MLSYVDYCVYWYTYEETGKWSLGTIGKILYVNLIGYAHLFVSIWISQLKDHSISLDQARYATPLVAKYLVSMLLMKLIDSGGIN